MSPATLSAMLSPNPSPSGVEPPSVAAIAALCKALGDPLRANIVRVLSSDSFGVLELCQIFRSSQPGMSHHLKVLREAGVVVQRREGNSIFYRRALPDPEMALAPLYEELLRSIDSAPLDEALRAGMRAVQVERAERSRAFFAENIDRFRQQQELVADYSLYGAAALEMVQSCTTTADAVLEVGPGEGAFLVELASLFGEVYALERSAAMLSAAQQRTAQTRLNNVHFWHGDTGDARLADLKVDCVVINMVLHHVPEPSVLLREIVPVLSAGASLIITELCRHDQVWTRERCGDVWLGFEPEELDAWAAEAGLMPSRSLYLAQRNGFRVQIRQFVPNHNAQPTMPVNQSSGNLTRTAKAE